jgi:hypothetical protein
MSPKLDQYRAKHLFLLVLRPPLGSQEEGFPGIDIHSHLGKNICDAGKLKFIFMYSSLSSSA